ncbi:MAG TPA: CPBP family intramembrane glutamic endopeptidase [Gaiellaceae bacterium]|jgi:hypothetical protein
MTSATPPRTLEDESRPAIGPIVAWSCLAIVQIALGFAGAQSDSGQTDNPLFSWEFVIGSLVGYGLIALLTIGIAAGYSLDFRRTFGFRAFAPRWLLRGAGVVVAALVVGVFMNLFTDAAKEQGLTPDRWEPDKALTFAAGAAVVVLVAPLVEELFFRGLGVGLLAFAGPSVAIGVPAVAFALAHGIPAALPTLLVFGGGLAWIRYRSESIWPCFLTHAAYNGVALAIAAASF